MQEILRKKPFAFKEASDCMLLAQYLTGFSTEESSKAKDIAGKLFMEIPDWEIFTPENEKKHD
jgi:hypothetical protein